jgi:hypothetical protein
MKMYGEWRYISTIFNLGTRWVSGHLHAPAALLPGKLNLILLDDEIIITSIHSFSMKTTRKHITWKTNV